MKRIIAALLAAMLLAALLSACGGQNYTAEKVYINSCETENTFILSTGERGSTLEAYDFCKNKNLGIFTSDEEIKRAIPSGGCVYILYDDYFLRAESLSKSPEKVLYPDGATPELIDFMASYDSRSKKWRDNELYCSQLDNSVYYNGEKVIEFGDGVTVKGLCHFMALRSSALIFYEKDGANRCGHYDLESGELICSFSMEGFEIISFLKDCIIFYDRGSGKLLIYDSDCAGKSPAVICESFSFAKGKAAASSDARFIFMVEDRDKGELRPLVYDRATGLITASEIGFSYDEGGLNCAFISNSGEYGFVQNEKGEYIKVLFERDKSAEGKLTDSAFVLPKNFYSYDGAADYKEYFAGERELGEAPPSENFRLLFESYEYFIHDYFEKDGPLEYYVPNGYIHPGSENSRLYVRKKGSGLCKMLIDEPVAGYEIIGGKIYVLNWDFSEIYCLGPFGGDEELLYSTEPYNIGIGSLFYYDEVCFFRDGNTVYRLHYGSGAVDKLLDIGNNEFYPVTNVSIAYTDRDSGKYFIYSELDKAAREITESEFENLKKAAINLEI